ncbi:MAG TPA: hypothetical protein VGL20_17460 [Candidatus Dormibacteraeota bacterium]|jgi:hypothetical protein
MRSSTLLLAGVSAVSIAAATTAAAGPLGHQRLAAAPGALSQPLSASLTTAATPDFGRRKGNPGAPTPAATKVTLTEANSGQTITVKPGTEIDVTLKPDSNQRWSQPRSDHPQTVSGGRGGRGSGWGGRGGHQAGPDLGPGGRGDGSTHAVFMAHRAGDATLSSAERSGGLLLLRPPTTGKSWSVKVTVSGPAPAAPKHAAPAAVEPATPAAPSATAMDVSRLVTPVAPAVQRLLVTLPSL